MVKKHPLIRPGKPSQNLEAEIWVNNGGLDPEIQVPSEPELKPEPETQASSEPEAKEAKKFPHRVSLDLDTATYKKVKIKAVTEDKTMSELIRELIEKHLN